jgi:hypothetical protein
MLSAGTGAIFTRDQLYDRLRALLPDEPRALNPFERDSLIHAAAAAAASAGPALPFRLRPGLLAEALKFYDQLRRQQQRVDRFEALIEQGVGGDAAAGDRGADRLRALTRWLALTFREYERRVAAAGVVDEHTLRDRLMVGPLASSPAHVIVTVADWVAEPDGLFVADFDLLARLPGLEHLDVVTTEALLRSGFHERLHQWLPEIDEVTAASLGSDAPANRPRLLAPAETGDTLWFTYRDREEELVAIARRIKAERRPAPGEAARLDRTAVVFKRPLPYLYVAPAALGAAGVPFQSPAALPLASEPVVSVVDLVLDAVESDFTRTALVALLRSPHLAVDVPGESVSAFNHALSDERYLGGVDRLAHLGERWRAAGTAASPAADRAVTWALDLAALRQPAPASQQVDRLTAFLDAHGRAIDDADSFAARERRARTAMMDALRQLARAHADHHDPVWAIDDLAPAVRRWIEQQTFGPDVAAPRGVHLIDDRTARYGDFDDLTIVGLIEQDWPEARGTNIFYPRSVLNALGWPSERDWRAAEDARLMDLVTSPSRVVSLSTFTLDDERLSVRSIQLDDMHRARLSTMVASGPDAARVSLDEALAVGEPTLEPLPERARAWAALRLSRPEPGDPVFHGAIGPQAARPWSVSALETYLACPFKFLAQYILRLEEEPEDEEVMDPRQQGQFMHAVFEAFFRAWQQGGGGGITAANLHRARALFGEVVERKLTDLPSAEAEVERTRLLGSPAAAGLAEAVLRMEAERGIDVVDRLLEYRLAGPFTLVTPDGPRAVELVGKADRIDLLADGTFRLIDYKLGWPPKGARALQLGVYAVCAEQRLDGHRGRRWTLGEAAYLAFKGPRRVVPLIASRADRDQVLADIQVRVAQTVDAIGRGECPPRPEDVFLCETCRFGSVCRKDYVGDV